MAGPEAQIERQIALEAKRHGWTVHKLAFLDCRGAPDRIFGRLGECMLIEFKADPATPPTTQQLRRHKELQDVFGLRVESVGSLWLGRKLLRLPEFG